MRMAVDRNSHRIEYQKAKFSHIALGGFDTDERNKAGRCPASSYLFGVLAEGA